MTTEAPSDALVGRLVGRKEKAPELNAEELLKLKALLERLYSKDFSEIHQEGFEPPTLGSEDRCAIQLRHWCS